MRFTKFSVKQLKVLNWWAVPKIADNYTALVCDGAVRSGKTLCMSISFIVWAMSNFTDCNFGICGKTVRSAERNIIMPLLGVSSLKKNYKVKYSSSKSMLTVKKGSRVNRFYIFGGKDESSYMLIQGITLAGILFDEVALMPKSFVDQALARCSIDGARFWFNCNPENPNHWFYKEWILKAAEMNAIHLHFLMTDNPSLSQETLARYEKIFTGVFRERYILGKWVRPDGLVYPMFNKDNNVVQETDENGGTYYISIDYGTLNPCSMGLWCVVGGVATRIKEYYHDGRESHMQQTDEEYNEALERLAGDKIIKYVVIDPSAASFIECIRRHGKYNVRQADNSVLNGIRNVSTMLTNGMIKIHESCKDCIREFGSYSWDDKAVDEDRVIKELDHAMDDVRYFVNTILSRENRFKDWFVKVKR